MRVFCMLLLCYYTHSTGVISAEVNWTDENNGRGSSSISADGRSEFTTIATTFYPAENSTTSKIISTSSESPISTTSTNPPKPNPPNPHPGIWTVTDGNQTCIIVKMTASFTVPYFNMYSNKTENSSSLSLPSNATSKGSCFSMDSRSQEITISWFQVENDSHSNISSLTLMFKKNITEKEHFFIEEFKFVIFPDPIYFPNSSGEYIEGSQRDQMLFFTSVNNSYRCNSGDNIAIPVFADGKNLSALLHLSNVQVEAFRSDAKEGFSKAVDCPADGMLTSDIVPIAVGCALAALVVVVLIAYLIGRRRARQRGYQSV